MSEKTLYNLAKETNEMVTKLVDSQLKRDRKADREHSRALKAILDIKTLTKWFENGYGDMSEKGYKNFIGKVLDICSEFD